ncbi:filamentous hemagglutinin N-terminal domain-containing protein [Bordetella petrii]|nr:filamentous hemagglutinin N-terminal domain-containing protein [Bordetella petrii]
MQLRLTPLASALAALALAGSLVAPEAQANRPFSGGWMAAKGATQAHAARTGRLPNGMLAGAGAANRQQHAARQQVNRSVSNMSRAAASIAANQAAQLKAREAALKAASNIPDGVAPGGLEQDLDAGWEGAERALGTARAQGRTEVTVRQTDKKAILNWKTFNVSRNTTVNFDQSGGTDAKTGGNDWSVLNRINDPSGKPSEIAGRIKAQGSVYLINRNGVVFSGSSQVNVRNLVAASLKLSDEQFHAGLNKKLGTTQGEVGWVNGGGHHGIPTFGENPAETSGYYGIDDDKQVDRFDPGPAPGEVQVEAGARLTAEGGRVMLFAPKVGNAGEISTPGGQTLMAAGENVWLEAKSDNPVVRGFDAVVSAVRPWTFHYGPVIGDRTFSPFQRDIVPKIAPMMEKRAGQVGYAVSNTGLIQADRGDITMVSRDVRQDGVLQASTALNNQEGSIRLRAWGQGMVAHYASSYSGDEQAFGRLLAWSAGTLTLGENSVTQVVNEWRDPTQVEIGALANRYRPGRVELYGKTVEVRPDAYVSAAAGRIDVRAAAHPWHLINGARRDDSAGDGSRILIHGGATLDTAGLLEMPVDMARNFIEAELRINELRDSPLQAGTWLYGRKVVVDRRMAGRFADGPMAGVQWVSDDDGQPVPGAWIGTPLADVTGWVGAGLVDLAELAARGGAISLQSGGAIIARPGSMLDVSGGSIRYEEGLNTATRLRGADGRIYNISSAPTDMTYVGIAGQETIHHERWGVTRTFTNPIIGGRRYEPGYLEGADAGAIDVKAAGAIVLEGDFRGAIQPGDRAQGITDLAPGGRLTIGGPGKEDRPWSLGRVIISAAPQRLPDDFGLDGVIGDAFLDVPEAEQGAASTGRRTWLSETALNESGLGAVSLYVTGGFVLEEGVGLDLMPGTAFSVTLNSGDAEAGEFDVQGRIHAPGGRIDLAAGAALRLGAGSVLDVGGQWINDRAGRTTTLGRAIDAGSITLATGLADASFGSLEVGQGARLDVSGGGWLPWDSAGRGAPEAGDAGAISLAGIDGKGLAALDMRAWSGAAAGRLSLRADGDVQIGGAPPATSGGDAGAGTGADAGHDDAGGAGAPAALRLPAGLYGDRGFGDVEIAATGSIAVPEGARADLRPLRWRWEQDSYALAGLASGAELAGALVPGQLSNRYLARHAPGRLALATLKGGSIRVERDAQLAVEPGGTVSLSVREVADSGAAGDGSIWLGGRIAAPGGRLDVTAAGDLTLDDGAALLLPGAAQIFRDERTGLRQGRVLDGGFVSLEAGGNLLAHAGARIDVSGASGVVDHWSPAGIGRPRVASLEVGSGGGRLAIRAPSGLVASRLDAGGGTRTARDGEMDIAMVQGGSGGGGIKQALQNFDPRWYDLTPACGTQCDGLEGWELAVDFDWNQVLEQWGLGVGEPMILPRSLVESLSAPSFFTVSDSAAGGTQTPVITVDYSDAVFDGFAMLGLDLRPLLANPPPILRPGAAPGRGQRRAGRRAEPAGRRDTARRRPPGRDAVAAPAGAARAGRRRPLGTARALHPHERAGCRPGRRRAGGHAGDDRPPGDRSHPGLRARLRAHRTAHRRPALRGRR